jgi:hypothetical protein
MDRSRKTRGNKERGVAMLVAILAVALLAIIGLGFMYMADTESSANNSYKDAQRAYFASRAGLESVRSMLALGSPFAAAAAAMQMPANNAPGNAFYVENSTGGAVDPTAGTTLDTELCKEQFPGLGLGAGPQGAPCNVVGTNYFTPIVNPAGIPNSNTGGALLFPWVRVTNKQNYMGLLNQMVDGSNPGSATAAQMQEQVCWDGVTQYPILAGQTCAGTPSPGTGGKMNPVWVLTSLALTPPVGSNPGSRRMTQMEVAIPPPLSVLPNGTVAARAPITLRGSLTVNGYDNCTCTTSGGSLPGAVCDKSKWAIYSANTVTSNGASSETITSGQNPPIDQNASWPYKIPQLIDALSAGVQPPAGLVCTGTANPFAIPPVYENCGTVSGQTYGDYPNTSTVPATYGPNQAPQTTFIPGSIQLSGNTSGSGILIVNGDLDVHGGLNFYGLIIVLGRLSFTGGGSQSVNLFGALLAGEDVNAQDQALSDDIGGSFNFHYDSCALKLQAKQKPGPPTLLAEHEAMY